MTTTEKLPMHFRNDRAAMRDLIAEAAKANGRSVEEEIEYRLQMSFWREGN